ncbi:TolB family protein [Ornatilinea apprima]|nr:PD40 domain-containing protein [Ornatilinea apprima]
MNRDRYLRCWMVLMGLLSACQPAATAAPPATPEALPTALPAPSATPLAVTVEAMPTTPPCKRIAFALADFNSDSPQSEIYTACPDGTGLTRLTDDSAADLAPAWSPDGTRIAFASARAGGSRIFVMGAAGGEAEVLSAEGQHDMPLWIPGGEERVAYRCTDGQGRWWWEALTLSSGAVERLSEPSFDFFFQTPAWSPDGAWLAVMSLAEQAARNDGASQIHIQRADGSQERVLTSDAWANISPQWSPDGQRIAFLSERDGVYNRYGLYVMDADGSHPERIGAGFYSEGAEFAWSPDGMEIAISEPGSGGIVILDLTSGAGRPLLALEPGQSAFSPAWQP